jgi:hypothetical protein
MPKLANVGVVTNITYGLIRVVGDNTNNGVSYRIPGSDYEVEKTFQA